MLVKHSTISDKVYFEHPEFRDIKVPFKKISQTDTISENGNIQNPDLIVYDTSGPLSDPDFKADTKASRSIERIGLKILIQKINPKCIMQRKELSPKKCSMLLSGRMHFLIKLKL